MKTFVKFMLLVTVVGTMAMGVVGYCSETVTPQAVKKPPIIVYSEPEDPK
jgi:hypothetical protein